MVECHTMTLSFTEPEVSLLQNGWQTSCPCKINSTQMTEEVKELGKNLFVCPLYGPMEWPVIRYQHTQYGLLQQILNIKVIRSRVPVHTMHVFGIAHVYARCIDLHFHEWISWPGKNFGSMFILSKHTLIHLHVKLRVTSPLPMSEK
jgi:hypothetical protein